MAGSVLITGGAGFIGSHLADELLRHGYRVRVLDSLVPQVHGLGGSRPKYLDPEVELFLEVLERFCRVLNCERIEPEITGNYRAGDIRHCFADISSARTLLGYTPRVEFEQGLAELATWLEGEVAIDRVTEAHAELTMRGLTL